MQNEEGLTPAERELEAALGVLRPAGAAIDRDRLMYRAGQAAGRRHQRIWQGGTGVLAVALASSLLLRPAPKQVDRYVYVDAGSPARTASFQPPQEAREDARSGRELPSPDGNAYLRLRQDLLVRGVDALPTSSGGSATAAEPLPRIERLLKEAPPRQRTWNLFGIEKLIARGEHS